MNRDLTNTSGFIVKTNDFGDRQFYNVTRGLFDNVGSAVLYDKHFKKFLFNEDTLYILLGTDSGLLPNYIHQQGIPNGARYLFIELENILSALDEHQMLSELHPSIQIISGQHYSSAAEELKINEYLYINAVKHVPSLSCQQNNVEEYNPLKWQVQEWLDDAHWKNQVSITGNQMFISTQLENCADNEVAAHFLKNHFAGHTVIILAGGPSLTETLPWVKKNRGKLIVFSVARISKQLLEHDISPDFIFAVDPYEISFNMCCDAFEFNPAPVLVHANHVVPQLLNQWHGSHLYLSDRLPWKTSLNTPNEPGAGPTVTNAALSVADLFGFQTILLAGVDLCFTKTGITHAKGSTEAQAGPKYNTTSLQILTYCGEYHPTSIDFHTALMNLSAQAKKIIRSDKTIINLSPMAASAEGIIHKTIEHISLPKKARFNMHQIQQDILDFETSHQKTSLKKLLRELKQAEYQIDCIESLAKEALTINKKLFNKAGQITDDKLKKELDAIENTLNKKYKKYSKLTKVFSIRGLIKITKPYDDDREIEAHSVQALGHTYYDAYQAGARHLKKIISQTILRTESRLEESKTQPDFNLLFEQWRKDRAYQRGMLWRTKYPKTTLSEEIQKSFQDLAHAFVEHCDEANQKNKQRVEKKLGQISDVSAKAKQLFNQKKCDALQQLLLSLQNDSKNQHHQDYQAIVEGYIAELNQQPETALQHYNFILNYEHSSIVENALNRITEISIQSQDYQNARLALHCLSQISIIYLPFYAHASRLAGELIDAIDAYNLYIEHFPDDMEVQLKLCRLYLHHEIPEAAKMLVDNILSKHPTMDAALKIKEEAAACI